jgi:hypothetical protein
MIHRVNSVAPDLDDRVIKPNQARSAKNLRFGASTDDSNLSGGVMVNGNKIVLATLPAGVNQVIGVLSDMELQVVYFCFHNSLGAHGIYRIKTVNNVDVVEAVLGGTFATGSWMNFVLDSEVSMTSIDGKLYWTDNINQPRMVNIEKGIRTQLFLAGLGPGGDTYPQVPKEWHYTQIKRAPQALLEISGVSRGTNLLPIKFTLGDASVDLVNIFKHDYAWQFSYYYVYDNEEESRIAPITYAVWSDSLGISIPNSEYSNYVKDISLIKRIVFIYRKNNEGSWNVLKSILNNNSFNRTFIIENMNLLAETPVSSNITSSFFDAVPRVSATNEIAQNRINHGNYLIDYPNWTGLNLTLELQNNPIINQTTLEFGNRTFYRGFYSVGIELLDEWGRRISVVNQKTIEILNYTYNGTGVNYSGFSLQGTSFFVPFFFGEDGNNCYKLKYTVSGTFPSWCKYWRVVYSKNQSYNYFNKTIVKTYTWYSTGSVDYLATSAPASFGWNNVNYTKKGLAVELSSGEPFLFTQGEEQYISIAEEYPFEFLPDTPLTTEQKTPPLKEYKITKQVGSILYIEMPNPNAYLGWVLKPGGNPSTDSDYFPLYFQIYLYSKKLTPDEFYYQSTSVNEVGSSLTGELYGDCYLNKFKKQNQGTSVSVLDLTYQGNQTRVQGTTTVSSNTITVEGYGFSMNIRDIYSQLWVSDIGQLNIVNENQKEIRIQNGICFSDPLIAGTQVNGLSKFDPLDIRQAPLENGAITALVTTNATQREPGVMLSIGSYGVSSFYYDSVQLTNVDGTTNIAVSDRYLASQRPLQGQFGSSQLRSVTKTPLAAVYWWSDVVNDFIRYSNAGLERLGLTYMFGNKLRTEVAGKKVATVYDYVTDEVILMPRGSDSFVFSERYKTFQGMREYNDVNTDTPERGISISQKMYHFINGSPWVTTVNTPKNDFFGVVKNPELTIITNEAPSAVKQWNQIKVFGPKPSFVNMISGDAEGFVRQSFISPSWWIQRKGEYNAAIRRDTISGFGDGMTGKVMESRILYSTFVFDASSFEKLNFIEVKSNMSVVQ